jgi:short-subunit dehydrogenase
LNSLESKVFIVTGASDGIGAQIASSLRRRGAKVALSGRNEERLRLASGAEDLIVPGDLTREEIRVALVNRAIDNFGRIDGLINNAARGSYHRVFDTPSEDTRAMFELNFFAPLHLAQLVAPYLRQTRGTLVNVSSIAGQVVLPWLPIYSATKFALSAVSVAQRADLRRDGVHVMVAYPGYVNTRFQSHATGPAPPARLAGDRRFAVSPEVCSEAIVRGIERRRPIVVTPRTGLAFVWFHRFFPAFLDSRLGRV